MRTLPRLLAVAALAACARAADTPPPAAALTLADFAGTWNTTSTLTGVANPVPSTMSGTADAASWKLSLEGRDSIPLTVQVVGDSLVVQSAEYESILRAGVMVSVRTASVLKDGALEGNMVATYKTPTGEEVVTGTTRSTRAN